MILNQESLELAKNTINDQESDFYVVTDDMLLLVNENHFLPFGFPMISRLDNARYHEHLRFLVKMEQERE